MGFVSDLIGSTNKYNATAPVNNFQATAPQLDQSSYAQAIQQLLGQMGGTAPGNATAAQQTQLAQDLMAQANGQGPSLAQQQLQNATQQNAAQAAGAIASQRGMNPALAARLITQNQASTNQQAAGQSALTRLQEQLASRQQLGDVLSQQRAQDIGQQQATTQGAGVLGGLQNQQNQVTSQNSLGTQQLNQATAAQNANLNLGAQQINAGVSAQNANTNAGIFGGVLGAAGAFGMAASDERAKTHITRHSDEVMPHVPRATFEYKNLPGVKFDGVIAQDVEKTHPELVGTFPGGMKGVHPALGPVQHFADGGINIPQISAMDYSGGQYSHGQGAFAGPLAKLGAAIGKKKKDGENTPSDGTPPTLEDSPMAGASSTVGSPYDAPWAGAAPLLYAKGGAVKADMKGLSKLPSLFATKFANGGKADKEKQQRDERKYFIKKILAQNAAARDIVIMPPEEKAHHRFLPAIATAAGLGLGGYGAMKLAKAGKDISGLKALIAGLGSMGGGGGGGDDGGGGLPAVWRESSHIVSHPSAPGSTSSTGQGLLHIIHGGTPSITLGERSYARGGKVDDDEEKKKKSLLSGLAPLLAGGAAAAGTYGLMRKFSPSKIPELARLQNAAKDLEFQIAASANHADEVPLPFTGGKKVKGIRSALWGAKSIENAGGDKAGKAILFHTPETPHTSGTVNINRGPLSDALNDKGIFAKIMQGGTGNGGSTVPNAAPKTMTLSDALRQHGGLEGVRKAFGNSFVIKPTSGAGSKAADLITDEMPDSAQKLKDALSHADSHIVQEKLPITDEFRVHTINNVPFAAVKRQKGGGTVAAGQIGALHAPAMPVMGGERKKLMEFVRNATKHIGEAQNGDNLLGIEDNIHQGLDVVKLKDGSYRVLESNPVPGTLMNPIIARKLQRMVTGRWDKGTSALAGGAAGLGAYGITKKATQDDEDNYAQGGAVHKAVKYGAPFLAGTAADYAVYESLRRKGSGIFPSAIAGTVAGLGADVAARKVVDSVQDDDKKKKKGYARGGKVKKDEEDSLTHRMSDVHGSSSLTSKLMKTAAATGSGLFTLKALAGKEMTPKVAALLGASVTPGGVANHIIGSGIGALAGYGAPALGNYVGTALKRGFFHAKGGEIAGQVPGEPEVDGDDETNDTVPAMLSPGEVVLPRSVTTSEDPEESARRFMHHLLRKEGVQHFDVGGAVQSGANPGQPPAPSYLNQGATVPAESANKELVYNRWGAKAAEEMYPGVALPSPAAPVPADAAPVPELGGATTGSVAGRDLKTAPDLGPVQNIPAASQVPSYLDPRALATSAPAYNPTMADFPGFKDYKNAVRQEESGISEEADARGKAAADQADALASAQRDRADENRAFNTARQASVARRQQRAQDVENANVDPNRYWNSKSTGQKVQAAISLILGGLGAGLTHGPNQALQVLENTIDRDIDAQKTDLGKKQTLLSNAYAETHDLDLSHQIAQSDAWHTVELQLKEIEARSQNPIVKANAKQMRAQVEQKYRQFEIQLSATLQQRQAQYDATAGQGITAARLAMLPPELAKQAGPLPYRGQYGERLFGVATSPEGATHVAGIASSMGPLNAALDRLQQRSKVWSKLPFEERAKAEADKAIVINGLRGIAAKGGLNDNSLELYQQMISDPTGRGFDSFMGNGRTEELRAHLDDVMEAAYSQHYPVFNSAAYRNSRRGQAGFAFKPAR